MRKMKRACVLGLFAFSVLIFSLAFDLKAQTEEADSVRQVGEINDPAGQKSNPAQRVFDFYENKTSGFVPLPVIYYTPDTRLGFGVVGVYYFKIDDDEGEPTRLSFMQALADYTQNNQADFWGAWDVFTKEEKYILKGELRYRNFPDRFYGIGNNTTEADQEFYSFDLIDVTKMVLRKVKGYTYIGGDVRFTRYFNLDIDPEGGLFTDDVTGNQGGNNLGFGFVALNDSRDNIVNTFSGGLIEFSSYFFDRRWGSDFEYANFKLDMRTFHRVVKENVFAAQFMADLNFGDTPFTNMARVGSEMLLRGYANNRFRDQHFVGAQIEYRYHLIGRLGAVTYMGMGDVFSEDRPIDLRNLKYSLGSGLRFMLNKNERLHLRIDYAIGRGDSAFYIGVKEAF
ncbi:MAG: BamA/TamA family outer membrane protein [Cyclobacteriaceae bacterium]|nr:BamA/TamA family outer membrane protein [Cyclobacteriaceae bacterium]MCH8514854.1 BamA/TamA family outer membrane protein [Cyclobacteriaceae bacterium]